MSIAAMSVRWLCRKLRQVGEGTLGRHGRYLPTVAWLTSMPRLSSSQWMRGAPQSGFGQAHPTDQITNLGAHLGHPRRRDRHGTVIVDLERRRAVDLLPDRSAASTAKWIEGHPEVEIISRDRAGLYAEGARAGAPQARQVADRFHLLQNFREAVERQLGQFGAPIREVPIGEALQEGGVLAATDEPAPLQPPPQKLVIV